MEDALLRSEPFKQFVEMYLHTGVHVGVAVSSFDIMRTLSLGWGRGGVTLVHSLVLAVTIGHIQAARTHAHQHCK